LTGTDLTATATAVATATAMIKRYAARWSIEVAFEDAKQTTGVGQARNRLPAAVQRTAPTVSSGPPSPSAGTQKLASGG